MPPKKSLKKRVTKGRDGTKKRVKKQEGVQAGAGESDLVTLRGETEEAGPDQGQVQMKQQVEGYRMSVEAEIHQNQTQSQSQTKRDMGKDDDVEDDVDVEGAGSLGGGSRTDEEVRILGLILDFYESHPHHYDLTHQENKSYKLKARELTELPKTLGPKWTAPRIKTRFTSFRTDYVRLKKKVKDGVAKSGSSPKKLTPLQRFKLSRGKFLDEFCKPSALSEEMGLSQASQSHVSRSRCSSESDGDVVTISMMDTMSQMDEGESVKSNISQTMAVSQKMRGKGKSRGVIGLLETMYHDNQARQKKFSSKLPQMDTGLEKADNIGTSWASYLSSVTHMLSDADFLEWQRETFRLSMEIKDGRRHFPSASLLAPAPQGQVCYRPAAPAHQQSYLGMMSDNFPPTQGQSQMQHSQSQYQPASYQPASYQPVTAAASFQQSQPIVNLGAPTPQMTAYPLPPGDDVRVRCALWNTHRVDSNPAQPAYHHNHPRPRNLFEPGYVTPWAGRPYS